MNRDALCQQILELAQEVGALSYGDFTLASGKKSSYYFDGRLLSLHPLGAQLLAQASLPSIVAASAESVGGPATGGIPLVAAITLWSQIDGTPVSGFFVRAEAKDHGRQKAVEGVLRPGSSVAVVDDVCTTAGSLFRAIQGAENLGCTVVKVMSVLDRVEGGSEELRKRGYDFETLLEATPDGRVGVAKQ